MSKALDFFQDALGEGCLEYRETAALAFSLINSLPETPTEGVTNHCTYGLLTSTFSGIYNSSLQNVACKGMAILLQKITGLAQKFGGKSSIEWRVDFCWKLEQKLLDLRQVASIPERISR